MSKHSILLIEDNQDDYEAIERGFKAVNMLYPICWYKGSHEALSHLKGCTSKELPSVIILDLNMPGLDGRQFLEILKNSKDLKKIPVVILTTSTDEKDIAQCYEGGASTYMQKPVRFSRMKELCAYMSEYWFDAAILPEKNDEAPVL